LLGDIAAAAADTDRHGVQRRCFDAMAAAGLLGRPLAPPALQRELAERLFMADGSLTFCWLQHQMPLRRLLNAVSTPAAPAASALRDRWLEQVASGQALAGVAFAHLRRPGAANPAASRIPGGWRLDGRLDLPDVNYVGGSRQLRRRVTPGPPPAMAGGGDSEK
jgi:alkylation response protein AidB-like acyl-CoA dehydrogenase